MRRLREDDPGYDEDAYFRPLLIGKPFTGVFEDWAGDRLDAEIGYRIGLAHGYTLHYSVTAPFRPSRLAWMGMGGVDGIHIEWDEGGRVTEVAKLWNSRVVERLILDGGAPVAVPVMKESEREALRSDPRLYTEMLRSEPVAELYDEAIAKLREGTLWDDPLLLTDKSGDPLHAFGASGLGA